MKVLVTAAAGVSVVQWPAVSDATVVCALPLPGWPPTAAACSLMALSLFNAFVQPQFAVMADAVVIDRRCSMVTTLQPKQDLESARNVRHSCQLAAKRCTLVCCSTAGKFFVFNA